MNSFWTRFVSSIILIVVTVIALLKGGDLLFAIVTIISVIGLYELYRILNVHKKLIGIVGYLAGIAFDVMIFMKYDEYVVLFVQIFLLVLMTIFVLSFPKFNTQHVMLVFFGLFYVTMMLSYIYQIRMHTDGVFLVWLIFIGSWGSDTCAYCVGIMIGKHKMSPTLSPKKSIEGGIGGILGAAILGFIYGTIFKEHFSEITNPQITLAIICGLSSVISQIGDLAASAIKRDHDIKDYGNLIKGHGGILDRFDSVIFTAPVVYILLNFLK